jgi:hypothetical protein
MIRSFVNRAFVRLRFQYSSFVSFRSFVRVSCVCFVYRAFVSCIVRFSYHSCEAFVRFVCVFRLLAFGAYCKLIRSRICSIFRKI